MPVIELATHINAPIGKCFDLARNIDVHVASTRHTGETAIAGRTSGLIELGEWVTWRAKHFGIWQTLTSKITELEYPNHFTDEMVQGAFKNFRHDHYFFAIKEETLMKDIFRYESPYGTIFDLVILQNYMRRLLQKRNLVIKEIAEAPSPLKGEQLVI
ncbi:cell division protein [Mucilaginibacter sp. RCC_168]|uniref:SRPBCC family protein n=1 Tax=Mucilaginibacter sp. RCC_168 TaxID=3239221 RepID=UPI003525AECC